MSAALSVEALSVAYGADRALDGVSLAVPAGAFAVVLGPSGSGKSTLLGALGGFVAPTSGVVRIAGADVTATAPTHRPTATVFQDYALFPHMDLADNVGFGLRMRGWARRARRARAGELLALVGLEGLGERRPAALSGGQRQRVALARALAVEPQALLLDEPLGALDLALRRAMQRELKAIQRRLGTTFVHVTHDQEEAMAMADLVVVMNRGRVEDAGPPRRVYDRPATRFAAEFLGEINLLTGRTGTPRADGTLDVGTALGPLRVTPPEPLPTSVAVRIGFRPEAFRDASGGGALDVAAEVVETTFFGTHHRVVATAGPTRERLVAHLPPGADPRPGARVRLALDPDALLVFPAQRPVGRGAA